MTIKQITVFLENKSGRLNEVARVLAANDINMLAFCIAETTDFGLMRLIVGEVDEAVKALRDAGFAVILTEVDEHGEEHQRGMKTVTIPAHNAPSCRDVQARCIKFVVPEDLDVSGGSTQAMCDRRSFKARLIANTIDTDFRCCDIVTTI